MKKSIILTTLACYIIAALLCHDTTSAQKFTAERAGADRANSFSIIGTNKAGTYNCPAEPTGIAQALTYLGVEANEIKLIRADENNRNVEVTLNLAKIRRHEIPDMILRPGDTFHAKHGKTFKVFNFLTLGILGKVKK